MDGWMGRSISFQPDPLFYRPLCIFLTQWPSGTDQFIVDGEGGRIGTFEWKWVSEVAEGRRKEKLHEEPTLIRVNPLGCVYGPTANLYASTYS